MRKLIAVLSICVFSMLCSAQNPTPTAKLPSASESGDNNEVFVGYLRQPTDWYMSGNGVEANITHFFGQRFGVIADFDFSHSSNATDFDSHAFRFGGRYNLIRSRRVQPFVEFTAGGASLAANVLYFGQPARKTWYGFTWAGGGGVDAMLGKHWGARLQLDATKVPYGDHDSSLWYRVSPGIVWQW